MRTAHKKYRITPAFTLVEIVVVVPFLVITAVALIAFLATAIINLGTESARAELQSKAQTALNVISEDLFRADSFWLTPPSNVTDANKSGGWNAVSDSALIVTELAYDKNRQADDRQYVYQNSPGSCSTSAKFDNPISTNALIYFVQSGTLYERVLIPSQTNNCSTTYRKTSCPQASATASCPADRKLATEVESLTLKYFLPSSATPLTTAQMSADNLKKVERVDMTLKLKRTVNQQDLIATSTLTVRKYGAVSVVPGTIPVNYSDDFTGSGVLGNVKTGTPTKAWEFLNSTSSNWSRNSGGYATTTISASSNPMAIMDAGTGNVAITLKTHSDTGSAIYFRVVDNNDWLRVRLNKSTSSYRTGTAYTYDCSYDGFDGQPDYTDATGYGNRTCADVGLGSSQLLSTYEMYSTSTNYYVVLEKSVNGTLTQLASKSLGSSSTPYIKVVASDTTITTSYGSDVNAASQGNTVTEAVHQDGTKHGVGFGASSSGTPNGVGNFIIKDEP